MSFEVTHDTFNVYNTVGKEHSQNSQKLDGLVILEEKCWICDILKIYMTGHYHKPCYHHLIILLPLNASYSELL